MAEEEPAIAVAKRTFVVTMVGAVLFITAAFVVIQLTGA